MTTQMRKNKGIVIELTALLDVIFIMLFWVMINVQESNTRVREEADSRVSQVQEEAAAQLESLREQTDSELKAAQEKLDRID